MIHRIAIIGSGPAGLMCCEHLLELCSKGGAKLQIDLFEQHTGLGRKILIAGSSGLNIGHELPQEKFIEQLSHGKVIDWKKIFQHFFLSQWIHFIEQKLELTTFLGTSGRYFVKEMKSSRLLQRWKERLLQHGVNIYTDHCLLGWNKVAGGYQLQFNQTVTPPYQVVLLALGGGSWLQGVPSPLALLRHQGLTTTEFKSSNAGHEVDWNPQLLQEVEGKALKHIRLKTALGEKTGDLMITKYGIEGTPIYFYGTPGPAWIDLLPALSEDQIQLKLSGAFNKSKDKKSPFSLIKNLLKLGEVKSALLFFYLKQTPWGTAIFSKNQFDESLLPQLIQLLKNFPLLLGEKRPLSEAISSSGGLSWSELDPSIPMMLKQYPGIFAAGEMLDWDAPTGGFLIQTCVSMGFYSALGIKQYVNNLQ